MMKHTHKFQKKVAYVLDVDMGYGHSRAAHALKDLSGGKVITTNAYLGVPPAERELWKVWRSGYETLSRLRPVPIIGALAYQIVEKLQEIPDFYPRRDLSGQTLALREALHLIHKGLGRHLVEWLQQHPLPAICTHPIPAFALEENNYSGPIWCIPTDADVARAWVTAYPQKSRIHYLCANGRLMERLKLYGVRPEYLHLTGFPLPKSLIGGPRVSVLKKDLMARLSHLDPGAIFRQRYGTEVASVFGVRTSRWQSTRPLTLTYAVGGAGAQRAIGVQIIKSLQMRLKRGEIRLNVVAGTRRDVADEFEAAAKKFEVNINVLYQANRAAYFDAFTELLHETDVLWTKPSELAFFAGLGIPIIMAPPLGRQEEFNATWLLYVGAGIVQQDPRYTDEWLFDWLASGGLARAAWQGYLQAPTHGAYLIEDLVLGRKPELAPPPHIV